MALKNKKIGVIGLNSRAVAQLALRAGLDAYLVDYYSDLDLGIPRNRIFSLQKDLLKPNLREEYSAEILVDFAIEKLSDVVDSVILTSAVGCNPNLLSRLEEEFEILGNGSERVEKVKFWGKLEPLLEESGASYPETVVVKSRQELKNAIRKVGLPSVIKSPFEGGGVSQHLLKNEEYVERISWVFEKERELLLQRYVPGIPASASVLSNGEEAITVSVNRQLIGMQEFNALKEFTYCGNLVPLDSELNDRITRLSEEIISNSGLVGSNGIDYVISGNEVYFMEINPRFQDTIECVERYRGVNLVEEHLNAIDMSDRRSGIYEKNDAASQRDLFRHKVEISFQDFPYGNLARPEFRSDKCFGKAILFAGEEINVSGLSTAKDIADIPPDGSIIQPYEPLCSIFAEGNNNKEVLENLIRKSYAIQRSHECSE